MHLFTVETMTTVIILQTIQNGELGSYEARRFLREHCAM